ncbi:PilZ domain-containing protein [Mangrovitalea sediminis]|uniref:PilZ domain-containing protein n=1 Tax=Mangrovitalea sediminis TaxID=1982043 RepID=UPI000BE5AF9D|nr:PilZ domain-containing protein [Mangrovitalea sediminis]
MSEELAIQESDRRIKTRFSAPCLDIKVRRRGWLGVNGQALNVSCLDINRYGVAVLSPVPLGSGTRLSLDFNGQYITQSSVGGRVMSEYPYRTGYRIGIQFAYCMDRRVYSRAIDNALSRIEALYRNRQKKTSL